MAFPEAIDCVLGKRLAFRVKAQPTFNRSFVLQVSEDDQIIESVVLKFPIHEVYITIIVINSNHNICVKFNTLYCLFRIMQVMRRENQYVPYKRSMNYMTV